MSVFASCFQSNIFFRYISDSNTCNFGGSFFNALPGSIDNTGAEKTVKRKPFNAAFDDIRLPQSCGYIIFKPTFQRVYVTYERDFFNNAGGCIYPWNYCIDYSAFMHHPAKDDVFICGAVNKLIQEKSYVFNHHGFCLFCHLKGAGVPAPIAIKKHAIFKQFVQLAAYSRFADTHGAAYQIQFFQACLPLFLRMLYASIRYHIFCRYSTAKTPW